MAVIPINWSEVVIELYEDAATNMCRRSYFIRPSFVNVWRQAMSKVQALHVCDTNLYGRKIVLMAVANKLKN